MWYTSKINHGSRKNNLRILKKKSKLSRSWRSKLFVCFLKWIYMHIDQFHYLTMYLLQELWAHSTSSTTHSKSDYTSHEQFACTTCMFCLYNTRAHISQTRADTPNVPDHVKFLVVKPVHCSCIYSIASPAYSFRVYLTSCFSHLTHQSVWPASTLSLPVPYLG